MDSVQFRIPGSEDATLKIRPVGTGAFLKTHVEAGYRIEPTRGPGAAVLTDKMPENTVVELTTTDGVTWWTTPAELKARTQQEVLRGAPVAPDGVWMVPARWSLPQAAARSSATADATIKTLRFIGVDLPQGTARLLAARIERQLDPGPGLYRCPEPNRLGELARPEDLDGTQPSLLLIHGTASRTGGSFGGLFGREATPAWRMLESRYGKRIFGFEHETLSKNPLENVLDLLRTLPRGARLHLASHSRGGLVGELLARCAVDALPDQDAVFSPADLAVFETFGTDHAADLETMRHINALAKEKRIAVERFVRVACPAAGTTLASRRLDRYLNIIVNLLDRIADFRALPLLEMTKALLLAVVKETAKQRMDPAVLPGLEAQMPGSPLIRMLNNPNVRLARGTLSVISGDAERSGFWRTLAVFATDLFYRTDHDFVVNTAAMYGGTRRAEPAHFFFDQGPKVDHFHYFRNPQTQKALVAGLEGRTDAASGFRPVQPRQLQTSDALAVSRGADAPPVITGTRPVVFVVPGIMGTHLEVDGRRIWVDLGQIALGRMKRLKMDAPDVRPSALVESAYEDILQYLRATHDVVPFPFDWRKSIRDEARRMGTEIKAVLAQTDQPVRILAHSMGGLVARLMVAECPNVWDQMKQRPGCRFIMLGTPNGGSYIIPRVIIGREKVLRLLHLVDLTQGRKDLLKIVSRFKGLLELLPYAPAPDFFDADLWASFTAATDDDWVQPDAGDLAEARAVADALEASPIDPAVMIYVAGKANLTPYTHQLSDDGKRLRFFATARGDGRVPWDTGIPALLQAQDRVWYMRSEHGGMAAYERDFEGLLELLNTGHTARLTQHPLVSREADVPIELPEVDPDLFQPDEALLLREAVGAETPQVAHRPSRRKVKVYITHGDLGNARYPVMLGHHLGDGIVSAERALDNYLGGQLRKRHQTSIYPGAVETSLVLISESRHPPGGIVVGLDPVGELTPGKLARSVTHAALSLAIQRSEARADEAAPPRLSTLLIGTGFGGLSGRASIRAILSGIRQANSQIHALDNPEIEPIDAVEFIELYEDRAIQAARFLHQILQEERFEDFDLRNEHVRRVSGGRKKLGTDTQDWWHRLKVEQDGEVLTFTSLTDRARAEVSPLRIQPGLVAAVLAQGAQRPDWDPYQAQALFALLMPNDFKEYATDRRNILWIVDEETAAYPWELLYDAARGEQLPMAVRAGMLRQLATKDYRSVVKPATDNHVLVIGDPTPTDFIPLRAARTEAEQVAGLIEQYNYNVFTSIQEDALAILRAMTMRSYKVVHLAAHGVFEYGPEKNTGVVIGKDAYLTPSEINQVMTQVPELVFVNCCHLGRVNPDAEALSRDRHRLAANIGTQLIDIGVRAVVVAGWAVGDAAAELFARTFYTEMLNNGTPFGEAVRIARERTFNQHRYTNTWGAYQCYGDPFYRLRTYRTSSTVERELFVDPAEVMIRLQNILSQAGPASTRSRSTWLETELIRLEREVPSHWLADGPLAETLARCYAELDLFPQAIRLYESLREMERAYYSAAAVEQRASLQARWGYELATLSDDAIDALRREATDADQEKLSFLVDKDHPRQAAQRLEEGKARIKEGIDLLTRQFEDNPTTVRKSLLGSAEKRLAAVYARAGNRRDWAIKRAGLHYAEAAERNQVEREQHYLVLNWFFLGAILKQLGWSAEKNILPPPDEIEAILDQITESAARAEQERPSFWTYTVPAEIGIFRLLYHGLNDARYDRAAILSYFKRAWNRGGSYRKRRSVIENIDILILLLAPGERATGPVAATCRTLAAELQSISDELDRSLK